MRTQPKSLVEVCLKLLLGWRELEFLSTETENQRYDEIAGDISLSTSTKMFSALENQLHKSRSIFVKVVTLSVLQITLAFDELKLRLTGAWLQDRRIQEQDLQRVSWMVEVGTSH